MIKNRKSFVLHIDSLDVLDDLTNEQAGTLFKAIKAYQNNDDFELDSLTKIAFSPFKNQFARDGEKYAKTCERRAIAGSKGGKQKVANASKGKQKVANVADSVSKNKSDSDSKSDSKSEVIKRSSRFTPPSLEDVIQYCTERCNFVDPQNFIDHYTSNGWMRGKAKIKDWKACVRTWEKNSKQPQSKQYSDVTAQNIKNLEGGW
jgi:hypothetical protein